MVRRLVLVLNACYEPIRIIPALGSRGALKMITKGTAMVVLATEREIYPGIYLPSVIKLVNYRYVPIRTRVLSRKNIYIRDGYRCMYCGKTSTALIRDHDALTLDHIVPQCAGGRDVWENLVAACKRCTGRKGGRTPEEAGMQLIHRPLPANIHTPRFVLRALGAEVNEWDRYLFKDNAGEKHLQFA